MSLFVSFCLMSAQPTGRGINMWYINLRGVSPTNEKKLHCATTVAATALRPTVPPPPFPTPLPRPFLRVCLFFGYTDHPAPASFFKAHPAVQNNKRNAPCATVQNVASGIATFPATSRVAVGYVVPIGCHRQGLWLCLLLLLFLLLVLVLGQYFPWGHPPPPHTHPALPPHPF